MFDTYIYNPIYNLVILLADYIVDVGVVIILATIIIKIILLPLYNKQINSQIATKKAKPELDALIKKYKGRKLTPEENQQKARETIEIYKKYGINPFSIILLLIIQIPILLGLYWVFAHGGLPKVDESILYSFVEVPQKISMSFLGIFDLNAKSLILALLAGVTQFIHLSISMPEVKFSDLKKKAGKDFKTEMMNSFQVNIKYGLPILVFLMLLMAFNSAVALYWITANIFQIIQEFVVRDKKKKLREIK